MKPVDVRSELVEATRATHTFMGWSGPASIMEAHRDSDLRSGPPAVDARLASLIGTPSSRRGGAGRDWAGGARTTGRTAIILSKNARTCSGRGHPLSGAPLSGARETWLAPNVPILTLDRPGGPARPRTDDR